MKTHESHMKKILIGLTIVLAMGACSAFKKGWSQGDRDKLINGCVETAKKNPSLDAEKLKNYCTCYQQSLEKRFPNLLDMAKAVPSEISKSAEECLSLMFK